TIPLLERLRELGVSLSIDDFGTGYSSLAYLRRLPLDALKVDRSFIMDIPASQRDMEIAQAIIAMAQKLHLKVVAEGVE
ncbi:EAL domain-containing protein, partial [Pseudomonas aeruginosa]